VAKIAKNILNTNAPITPHKIICFLFLGTKFDAIEPTITALSAVKIIVIKIIWVRIISSSIKISNYYFNLERLQSKNKKRRAKNLTALIIVFLLNYLSDQVGIGYFNSQAANSNGYTVQYFPF